MDRANLDEMLIDEAIKARAYAYAPYSGFRVGAALLSADGRVYRGCNIENAAFSPTNCAERTAFFKAVSEGEKHFSAIAVAGWSDGGRENTYAFPCGVCRQVMMEFCDAETFRVVVADKDGNAIRRTLAQLLPQGFGPGDL